MKNNQQKSIVLLSGGMDSLLCLALSHQRGDDVILLHFDYGQLTFKKEKQCCNSIASYYQVQPEKIVFVDLTFLRKFGGSGLVDEKIALSTTGENLFKNVVPSSYVPFRNTIMLSVALSFAESHSFNNIVVGAVQDDELGYPDCRKSYFEAIQKVATLGGNATAIKIETPLIHTTKVEILSQLMKLNAPVNYSWSCYKNDSLACGVCDSCRLRLNAFKSLGLVDPIAYQNS